MATATVTIGETDDHEYTPVTVKCSECSYTAFTGGRAYRDWSHLIDDHLARHNPGRALDIEVDWTPSAFCSVCDDGIGDIHQEDDGLRCRDCGTTWDTDGTQGEREAVA